MDQMFIEPNIFSNNMEMSKVPSLGYHNKRKLSQVGFTCDVSIAINTGKMSTYMMNNKYKKK
jgi:hypothetical protein